MHPLVNHLIQLQELTLIKDEQRAAGINHHLQQLTQSINDMKKKLPKDIRDTFEKLHKKNHNVIIPISDKVCSVCGMQIPISLIQAVRIGKEMHSCPNCARILFYPESAPRWVGRKLRRSEPRKAGISRFSSQTLMVPNLTSTNKEDAIRELAYKMEAEGFVDQADRLVDTAFRREAILSTAIDHGLAFPHARGVEGGGLTLALGTSRKGIKFDGPGSKLSRIIFFIAIPTAASAFYLKLLAGLAETFMKADSRKTLIAAKSPDTLWKALTKTTRSTIK